MCCVCGVRKVELKTVPRYLPATTLARLQSVSARLYRVHGWRAPGQQIRYKAARLLAARDRCAVSIGVVVRHRRQCLESNASGVFGCAL